MLLFLQCDICLFHVTMWRRLQFPDHCTLIWCSHLFICNMIYLPVSVSACCCKKKMFFLQIHQLSHLSWAWNLFFWNTLNKKPQHFSSTFLLHKSKIFNIEKFYILYVSKTGCPLIKTVRWHVCLGSDDVLWVWIFNISCWFWLTELDLSVPSSVSLQTPPRLIKSLISQKNDKGHHLSVVSGSHTQFLLNRLSGSLQWMVRVIQPLSMLCCTSTGKHRWFESTQSMIN